MAHWNPELYGLPHSSTVSTSIIEERPARINYFASHSITVQGSQHDTVLFSASWFKYHPSKNVYGKPVTVWECDIFEVFGNGVSALLVCPCIDF